jgi:hypothetical protein
MCPGLGRLGSRLGRVAEFPATALAATAATDARPAGPAWHCRCLIRYEVCHAGHTLWTAGDGADRL